MDAAGVELADLDGLSVGELKALLHEKHAKLLTQNEQLHTQNEQLVAKDAQILSYSVHTEALCLTILREQRCSPVSTRAGMKPHQPHGRLTSGAPTNALPKAASGPLCRRFHKPSGLSVQ